MYVRRGEVKQNKRANVERKTGEIPKEKNVVETLGGRNISRQRFQQQSILNKTVKTNWL